MGETGSDLQAGRVGRAHGLDGSFYVTGAIPRLLTLDASVTVGERTAAIVRRSGTDARPIVRLAGIEDRLAAEALRGLPLIVRALEAPALGEGEWWAHELEGCEVLAGERPLGTVARLIELPSCEALEVKPSAGGDPLLVPMVKDAIRRIDVAGRRIEVDAEFLDLAEPSRPERRTPGSRSMPVGRNDEDGRGRLGG
jgi:16S rRNA processing protein RimM